MSTYYASLLGRRSPGTFGLSRRVVHALATSMLVALPSAAFPADLSATETFTDLFAQTCMRHFYSRDKLRELMASQNAPILSEEPSAFFLNGKSGTAWAVQIENNNYAVALRDDNVCAVFAQRAPIAEVQSRFASMVSTAPAPLVAARLSDASVGPNSASLKTVAYSWSRPTDKVQLVFTLTTSSDDSHTVRAMVSMALANKPTNH